MCDGTAKHLTLHPESLPARQLEALANLLFHIQTRGQARLFLLGLAP